MLASMRLSLVIIVISLWATLCSSAAPTSSSSSASDPSLTQLTAANWTEQINRGAWVIEFYSPYCSHCRAFKPMWSQLVTAKRSLADEHPSAPLNFAQVNCHSHRDLCVQEGVPHFPRLSVYRDGKQTEAEYQGDREYVALSSWVDQLARDYRQSKGQGDLPEQPQQPTSPSPSQSQVVIGPADAVVAESPIAGPAVAAAPSVEVPPVAAPIPASPPPPVEPAAAPAAPAPPPPPPPPPPKEPEPEPDLSLPNPYGKLLQFGISPGLNTLDDLTRWLAVSDAAQGLPEPPRRAGGPNRKQATKMPENANEGSHGTGSDEAGKGNGGAHLTSHAHAAGDESNAPLVDFNLLQNRNSSIAKGGTFVKFFAPWCHHCQAMAKAFESLAPALKNRLNVLEVDCEANKAVCRAFRVQSFPTLRLYSPNNKLVSDYRGSRSHDAMLRWCEKAAEEEVVDLVEVHDPGHWDDISRREEVRFLWLSEPSDRAAHEKERVLVTLASRILFTSAFRVYRSSHPDLLRRFESRLSSSTGKGYRSALLVFKDNNNDRPTAAYHLPSSLSLTSVSQQKQHLTQWFDWNRYPTVSSVGGDSFIDVINNAHQAPVVLALLSDQHHDGATWPVGSGSARREAELASVKRMAMAWRESGSTFKWYNSRDSGNQTKYTSNGGLIWGWIDADRWKTAVQKYYHTSPDSLPSLLLVDSASMTFYPLPTLSPSEVVDIADLDPPPADKSIAKAWHAKQSYFGVSREISTWLGQGAKSPKVQEGLIPSSPSSITAIIDDLEILPFLLSIAAGEKRSIQKSSRSYLDRYARGVESFFGFIVRHWFLTLLFIAAIVAVVRLRGKQRRKGGEYRLQQTKAD